MEAMTSQSVGPSNTSMHCGSRVTEKGVCVDGKEDEGITLKLTFHIEMELPRQQREGHWTGVCAHTLNHV